MQIGLTLLRHEPVRERISYSVTSLTRYATGALNAVERDAALALPPISSRVRAFATALRTQHRTPAAISDALLAHFHRENFVYTLTPPLLGDDPTDQFLFEARRGFCEHFASAMAVMAT